MRGPNEVVKVGQKLQTVAEIAELFTDRSDRCNIGAIEYYRCETLENVYESGSSERRGFVRSASAGGGLSCHTVFLADSVAGQQHEPLLSVHGLLMRDPGALAVGASSVSASATVLAATWRFLDAFAL